MGREILRNAEKNLYKISTKYDILDEAVQTKMG